MSDPHFGFIAAAYVVSFMVVGATIVAVMLRHRALKRALARFGNDARG